MTSEDRALLGAILEELRGLRADLARRGRRPDHAEDQQLLASIAAAVAGRVFSAAELLEHARVDRELAAALEAAEVREARALGATLRGLRARAIDGYVVRAVDRDQSGVLWQVLTVDADQHTGSSATRLGPA